MIVSFVKTMGRALKTVQLERLSVFVLRDLMESTVLLVVSSTDLKTRTG